MAGALIRAAVTFVRNGKQVTQMRMVKPENAKAAIPTAKPSNVSGPRERMAAEPSKVAVATPPNVKSQVSQLNNHLGNDASFSRQLAAVSRLDTQQVVQIAREFAFAPKSVKSKAAALKAIENRHKMSMVSKARLDATNGRIAG